MHGALPYVATKLSSSKALSNLVMLSGPYSLVV